MCTKYCGSHEFVRHLLSPTRQGRNMTGMPWLSTEMKDRESSLPLAYTCGVPKVCSNKSLNIEIKLNSLADIRGYLFNFGTGVCKN